ncbi:MAG: glycosyltransferase [Verrucomicrobia bacterium]|nr:glycosyltransferase [Verrucomicrobiota bacterium]
MKILHVIDSINLRQGGPSVSVPALAAAQAKLGHEVTIVCRDYRYLGPMATAEGVKVRTVPGNRWNKKAAGWGCSFRRLIEEEANKADVVHNHGVWLAANYYARKAAVKAGKPLVVSPRGMLEEWSLGQSKLRKSVVWQLFEKKNLESAALFHATSSSEAEVIATALRMRMRIKIKGDDGLQATGGGKPSVDPRSTAAGGKWPRRSGGLKSNFEGPGMVVAANGVEIPEGVPRREVLEKRFPGLKGKKWIVFMSRVHPKKGLLELAKAWREVRQRYPGWELAIAGPVEDGKYADRVRKELKGEGVWTGELAGEAKWCALGHAEFVALPTYSENFGIVVAEGLAAGRPVLTTTGTPWGAVSLKMKMKIKKVEDIQSMNLEERGCGVICEPGVRGVRTGLGRMLKMSDVKRKGIGARGRKWMKKEFGWEKSAKELIKAYQRIV